MEPAVKEIGQVLQHNNVDYLGVAYTDEGLDLRNEGIAFANTSYEC